MAGAGTLTYTVYFWTCLFPTPVTVRLISCFIGEGVRFIVKDDNHVHPTPANPFLYYDGKVTLLLG